MAERGKQIVDMHYLREAFDFSLYFNYVIKEGRGVYKVSTQKKNPICSRSN